MAVFCPTGAAGELGLKAEEKEFVYCGQRKIYWKDNFYGKLFVDNQISNVYCLWRDVEPEQLKLQPEEVEEVCWMSLDDCREAVCKGSIPNCISMEELECFRGPSNIRTELPL